MRRPRNGLSTLPHSNRVQPNHFVWRGQHPRAPLPATDGTPQELAERMLKARRDRIRARTTAIRGLQLSFMLALLVGWVFLGANPLQSIGTGEDQCESIGLPMGPAAQNRLRAAAGRPASANVAQKPLSITVCDPDLVAMLKSPTMRTQLREMKGLRSDIAGLFGKPSDDVSMLSVWKELVGQSQ